MNEFNSEQNKTLLQNILIDDLKDNYNIQYLDQSIQKSMNYVKQNVNKITPSNISDQKYLYLLNKKVYDLVLTSHKKQPKKQPKNKIQSESKNIQNNLFDADILRNYNNTDSVIDYPKPSSENRKNVSSHYDKLQEERSLIYPKVNEINFELDNKEDNKKNTMQNYNKLLSNYNEQIDNFGQFEENQKQMNQKIDNVVEEYESSTPIHQILTPINSNQMNERNQNNQIVQNNSTQIVQDNSIEQFQNFLVQNKQEIKKDTKKIQIEYNKNNLENNIKSDSISYSSVNMPNNNIMLKEPDYKQILKTDSIIVSSRNRNLELFPNQTKFIVKFSPNDNNYIFSAYRDENDVLLIREKKIVIGNYSENDIGETFDNIKYIKCKAVSVPTHSYEYVGVVDNESISDDFGLTLFKDSYLLLEIPELRGPYRGGTKQVKNALVQLRVNHGNNLQNLTLSSNFSNLEVADEIMEYDPVTLGKLDKFTINLNNKNGRNYNFGIDKIFVKNFSKGELKYLGPCGKKSYSTKFEIQRVHDDYTKYCGLYYNLENCDTINDNPLNIRDLLYFYKIIPNEDEMVLFEKIVKIESIEEETNTIKINLEYEVNGVKNTINIQRMFADFMSSQDKITDFYIIFIENGIKFAFQILEIDEFYIYIQKYNNFPNFPDLSAVLVGITKGNKAGIYDEKINSLFDFNGYNVISVKLTKDTKNTLGKFIIEIDYPWDNLPYAFKNNLFSKDDVFFIQDKKQITYVFSMTYHVKDYNQLDSYLNESGNN